MAATSDCTSQGEKISDMNIEKIKKLVNEIRSADIIRVNDGVDDWLVTMDKFRIVSGIKEDPNNTIVHIKVNDEGLIYVIELNEQGFNDAVVKGNTITLKDYEGNITKISKYYLIPDPIAAEAQEIDIATTKI
jgi:hypothetical protein